MTEPVDITVYVQSIRRRIRYQTKPDDPKAYQVTETLDVNPEEGDRRVSDLVALDEVRDELRIIRHNPLTRGLNFVWRAANTDQKWTDKPYEAGEVAYHYDHPEHGKGAGFF